MRRRWRRFSANPGSNRTMAFVATGLAGLFAFTGSLLRAHLERGAVNHSATYLLTVIALLACVAAAIFAGRFADILGDAMPGMIRRGGVIRLLLGIVMALAGCLLVTTLASDAGEGIVPAAATALLFVGLALLLSGVAQLALSDGARYAATKVQERLDDDY